MKLREELRIAKTYEKWIKQEGTDKPPVCDNDRKKQENGIDSNKLKLIHDTNAIINRIITTEKIFWIVIVLKKGPHKYRTLKTSK